ncbi:glycosyltransferase family 2 protein [Terricaulis sp.]|uniref:glycosyltransferase family 2 protein n=1 Tax=Terricaulis sp. TaxID=2768686 RepID=UPI0037832C87
MHPAERSYRKIRSHLRPLRRGARDAAGAALRRWVEFRWRRRRRGVYHLLPAPLVVSLTSYPPRFATLAHTLKSLLMQSTRPDRIILWVAHADAALLTDDVRALEREGLQIETCEDHRSFKKILPALLSFPNAYVATADDDVYYPPDWLANLVGGLTPHQKDIPALRVHRVTFDGAGAPLPYAEWRHDVPSGPSSPENFPTGVGGALYPPGCLHADVLDSQLFRRLCPTSDDAWLYWMARKQGWCFRKVGPRRVFVSWPGAQDTALQHANLAGGNDVQIANLVAHYGMVAGASPEGSPVRRRAWAATW